MQELLGLARSHGLTVEWSAALGEYVRGLYEHERRVITLASGLTGAQARATLAHEIGHAWYGHRRTGDPYRDADAERLADEYAARLLIDPIAYAAAEQLVGPHPGAIARELGVTAAVVQVWQRVRAATM
jgi:Zn-dependent peptidase ImmA (M78 family)